MAAPTPDETPFQLNNSRFDPCGTVRREIVRDEGINVCINIWVCEEYLPYSDSPMLVSRRWRCIHSYLPSMVGQVISLDVAAGLEVIGATPGTPAMNLWIQHTYRHAGSWLPKSRRDDVISPEIMEEIRSHVRHGRRVQAIKLVRENSTRDLRQSRDYVRQLATDMKHDAAALAVAEAPLDEL